MDDLTRKTNIKENETTKPVLSYSSSKAVNEEQLKKSGKNFIILRLGSVYGYSTDTARIDIMPNLFSKISVIFSYFSLKKFKNKLDPRKYNGAVFFGLNGLAVKSHGGTDFIGFSNSLDVCHRIVKGNLIEKIKQNI